MAHLQGKDRADYVQSMFDRIARRYDVMNRLMTFGRDQSWRRFVVKRAALPRGGRLLDVATGTGDVMFEALKKDTTLTAIGADFAVGMMRVGQHRPLGSRVAWSQADALNLPFADHCFDAVTSGYLMRNVIDVPRAFREQMRVVKPGGKIVCLDTSPPPRNILRPFILIHLKYIIPLLGRIVSGNPDAYKYLPESTQAFKTPEELADIMRSAGLQDVRIKRFMFGTMAVHTGTRPQETQ
jgi:demethylmenaquinone methyltransferase/2-methoxy-6-polyprenyl-1,4-benzoquinol methylase